MNDETRIDMATAQPLDGYDHEPLGERPSRRKWWIVAAIALVLAVGAWLYSRSGSEAPAADAANQAPTVTVVTPGRGTIQATITATGTLGARREMPVGSVGEGGQIVQVLVEAGQWVRQGQVLAVIDRSVQTQQAASLGAQIQVSQADANLAQANLDRSLKLVARGFVSKADVDRLTATRDAANARVRVSRAQLGEAQARTARLNILAPAAGLVLERNAEPGQVVGGASGVLFRLARGGEMELRAGISEIELAQLAPGVIAQVTPIGVFRARSGSFRRRLTRRAARALRGSRYPMTPLCAPAGLPPRRSPAARWSRRCCQNPRCSAMTRAAMSTSSATTAKSSAVPSRPGS